MSGTEKLLTEAAGIKVVMTRSCDDDNQDPFENDIPVTKIVLNFIIANDSFATDEIHCGFHLTKSKWDPYPWIESVDDQSVAYLGGLRAGDCLINVDGKNLLGLKVKDIADLIRGKKHKQKINLYIWRCNNLKEKQEDVGIALEGPLPEMARKLVNAVSGAVRILECPICLDSAKPPVSQCVHGHILCVECRSKTSRCPVCRVRLGQGRCLFADELHRTLRDAFDLQSENRENSTPSESSNLRQKLFGKRSETQENQAAKATTSKPRQILLTRLLFGGVHKAVSAENISEVPQHDTVQDQNVDQHLTDTLNTLSHYDRAKSASTGELSKEKEKYSNKNALRNATCKSTMSSSAALTLSASQTPTWGGSMESVSNVQFSCPLFKTVGCKDIITSNTLFEHIDKAHSGPKIHFFSGNVNIPYPPPFGSDAVYMLHNAGEIFFFQYEEEAAWITSTSSTCSNWEWTLNGHSKRGIDIKIRKIVAGIDDTQMLLPQHIASLPKTLELNNINIKILECGTEDRSKV